FTFIDQDPSDDYQQAVSADVTSEMVYDWIKNYFLL
ncbi:MAG: hypothetical protein ACI9EX_001003, partial [Oleispira sp.]